MIELWLWIYGIGAILALIITGYINYADKETSVEAVFVSIITSVLWPVFVGLFVMGMIYGVGVTAQILVEKMFGEKDDGRG